MNSLHGRLYAVYGVGSHTDTETLQRRQATPSCWTSNIPCPVLLNATTNAIRRYRNRPSRRRIARPISIAMGNFQCSTFSRQRRVPLVVLGTITRTHHTGPEVADEALGSPGSRPLKDAFLPRMALPKAALRLYDDSDHPHNLSRHSSSSSFHNSPTSVSDPTPAPSDYAHSAHHQSIRAVPSPQVAGVGLGFTNIADLQCSGNIASPSLASMSTVVLSRSSSFQEIALAEYRTTEPSLALPPPAYTEFSNGLREQRRSPKDVLNTHREPISYF